MLQGIVEAHGIEDVKNSIVNGIPPTMPAWGDTLTDEEIEAVVAFVATLEGEHSHEHDHDEHDDDHDDGHDHGDDHGDDHGEGHGDGHDDEHDDGHDHDHDHEDPGIGTPAPPVAGDPGFTG